MGGGGLCVGVGKRNWRHMDAGNVAQGSCRQAVVAGLGVRDLFCCGKLQDRTPVIRHQSENSSIQAAKISILLQYTSMPFVSYMQQCNRLRKNAR
jgi:hypothetical protein